MSAILSRAKERGKKKKSPYRYFINIGHPLKNMRFKQQQKHQQQQFLDVYI